MSQKRIWIGRLRHTRQIENHHKKDQILVYPEGDYIVHFPKFYHLQYGVARVPKNENLEIYENRRD